MTKHAEITSNFESQCEKQNVLVENQKLYVLLPPILERKGFEYTLVQRGDKAMIYKQKIDENRDAFEVFKRMISRPKNINGKIIPARERFPRDEDFGKTAWTYRTIEEAKKKFDALEKPDVQKNDFKAV